MSLARPVRLPPNGAPAPHDAARRAKADASGLGGGTVDEGRVLVGSVWAYRPGGDAPPPEEFARAFGVVVERTVGDGPLACVLLRLDRRAVRSGRAADLLGGCPYVGFVDRAPVDGAPSSDWDAALVAAALEAARAWAGRRRG